MPTDPAPVYIIAAAIIGAAIGYFAAALMAAIRMRRIAKDTWRQASLFFKYRYNSSSNNP